MYVQYSDPTKTTIISCFANAQDPTIYPNQGSVALNDSRYAAFFNGLPVLSRTYLPTPE